MQIKFAFALGLFVSLSFVWAGVDPFGGVLRFAGGARPCPLLIFGKFTIYNDSYGRTAHRARVYRNAFRRCGNRRKAGVEHGLFYR